MTQPTTKIEALERLVTIERTVTDMTKDVVVLKSEWTKSVTLTPQVESTDYKLKPSDATYSVDPQRFAAYLESEIQALKNEESLIMDRVTKGWYNQ